MFVPDAFGQSLLKTGEHVLVGIYPGRDKGKTRERQQYPSGYEIARQFK
jgi:hypothetical protein